MMKPVRSPKRHTARRFALAAVIAAGLAGTTGLAHAQFELPRPIGPTLPGVFDTPPQVLLCPDPVAQIRAEVIAPSVAGRPGRVRIHGTVHNNGGAFVSRPGQQVAQLFQGSAPVQSIDFPRIDSGRSTTFSRDVEWTPGGEFNSDFIVRLTYGPDIFIDDMSTNDDCQLANNEARLTAASIDALFAG